MSFRLSFAGLGPFGRISATPVAAIADAGAKLVTAHDPAIPADRWLDSGPTQNLELKMVAYRWARLRPSRPQLARLRLTPTFGRPSPWGKSDPNTMGFGPETSITRGRFSSGNGATTT